jgi:hypothetical protein
MLASEASKIADANKEKPKLLLNKLEKERLVQERKKINKTLEECFAWIKRDSKNGYKRTQISGRASKEVLDEVKKTLESLGYFCNYECAYWDIYRFTFHISW